ncbi:hypothetical protein ACFL2E_09580 [Thermodesulfobacteriota bacterium]
MKITYIFFVSIYGVFILFVNIGSAANYTFTWDAPHPNDNVVEYKIYYRIDSSIYNVTDFKAVLITNPRFNVTNPVWKIELPYIAEEYCFIATAIDDDGFESDPSNEIGKATTCSQIVNDGIGKEGGGGGGCYIWTMEVK